MSASERYVLGRALDWLAEGRRVALATVIQTWGSAPQPVGSQLAIDAEGNFLGSVSGGCVEAEVITEAAEVIASGVPKALEFGVEDNTAWSVGLACGGAIRIFVEPLEGGRGREPGGVLHRIISDIEARQRVALVTQLATGVRSLAYSPDDLGQDLAPALEDAFRRDKSMALAGSDGEVFINIFNPTIRLVIVGAVHVAQPLVPMARALGYDVVIVDPRSAFATEERFGNVTIAREWPDEALPKIGVDGRTALIALTHDPKIDDPALIYALSSDAFYVGALGSKQTHAKRLERLRQEGVSSRDLQKIHAPIGLDIGAQGAAEIALSIIAEITATQRGKGNGRR
ncbi:XdhC family protein [Methyloceanibacter sp.]|uniref:XdhC family protein n=1 Tax=Methyloceanibacter sp. TaxID=1965321 RepID=UPI003D6D3D00